MTATTATTETEPTPDQYAEGVVGGVRWTVARYGTLVLHTSGEGNDIDDDDIELPDEEAAIAEFHDLVGAWEVLAADAPK